MFPIHDERGEPVGFGGRILPGHEGPKYKNTTTEAEVYDKSRVLYGLHTHRDGIVKAGEAIICEGYTDVIGYATAEIPRAVATCGTALTEEHVKLLKRFSANRLVLSFDADAAGLAAAERVYAWEKEYELDIRVAALPPALIPTISLVRIPKVFIERSTRPCRSSSSVSTECWMPVTCPPLKVRRELLRRARCRPRASRHAGARSVRHRDRRPHPYRVGSLA